MRFSNEFGFCELNPLPGCSQMVVSNHAFVYPNHRGKGHGSQNHKLRLLRAGAMGYDAIMCTVRNDNEAQIAILEKNKWKHVFGFFNTETGHQLRVYMRHL